MWLLWLLDSWRLRFFTSWLVGLLSSQLLGLLVSWFLLLLFVSSFSPKCCKSCKWKILAQQMAHFSSKMQRIARKRGPDGKRKKPPAKKKLHPISNCSCIPNLIVSSALIPYLLPWSSLVGPCRSGDRCTKKTSRRYTFCRRVCGSTSTKRPRWRDADGVDNSVAVMTPTYFSGADDWKKSEIFRYVL